MHTPASLMPCRALALVSLLASFGAAAPLRAQAPSPTPAQTLPATPADQQPAQTNPDLTPALDQAVQPTSGAPVPQVDATPGIVKVPKAVPSMMPKVPGTEIDRVDAIVNGQIVLDSDVAEEHRFEAIQPYPGNSLTQPTRDREIERLINRDLILQQARLQTQDLVTAADVDKEITNLRKTLPGCKPDRCATDEGWTHFLASKDFTVAEFRTRWRQRMEVLAFIQERFGAGTSVTEGQIREFYQNTMLPQYRKAGTKPAPFTAVEPRIREILLQQQVSSLLRDWLQSLRAQGSITVLHPGEEAP